MKKLFITFAVLVVFILGDIFFILFVQASGFGKISKSYKEISGKLKSLQEDLLNQSKKVEYLNQLKTRLVVLEKRVAFDKRDVTTTLSLITNIASNRGITVISIKPMDVVFFKKVKDYDFFLLPFKVVIADGYHDLARFINDLESSEHFFAVTELNIKGNYPKNNVEMTICGLGV